MTSWVEKAVRVSSRPVKDSPEFQRIRNLPRREPLTQPPPDWAEQWRRDSCTRVDCPFRSPLNHAQKAALWEAHQRRGVFASIDVGGGKGWLGPLLTTAFGAQRPVLLVPSNLVAQTERILEHLREHWVLPAALRVLGYGKLSHKKYARILEEIDPDCLVADECHKLSNVRAAVTRRVRDWRKRRPAAPVGLITGTPVHDTIRDWCHLAAWALGDGSPAPRDWPTIEAWSFALDDLGVFDNSPPGVLDDFCAPDENVKQGYRRRVTETPGCIVTSFMSCSVPLVIQPRTLALDASVAKALKDLRATWQRPDGEYFDSALSFSRYARQLACGLYLRWTETPPPEWLEARREWNQEVRLFLSGRSRPGLDTPGLYEDAVKAGRIASGHYARWAAIEDVFRPTTETVWLSDFVAQDAARWARENTGVVWVRTPALGRRIAEIAGVRYYGEGPKAAAEILDVTGGESVVVSECHREGRNFQMFSKQLVTSPSSNGVWWHQLLGRLSRPGQRAERIDTFLYLHTPEAKEALLAAVANARFIQESPVGQPQRLCSATLISFE